MLSIVNTSFTPSPFGDTACLTIGSASIIGLELIGALTDVIPVTSEAFNATTPSNDVTDNVPGT